jgi:hypothetical protein
VIFSVARSLIDSAPVFSMSKFPVQEDQQDAIVSFPTFMKLAGKFLSGGMEQIPVG